MTESELTTSWKQALLPRGLTPVKYESPEHLFRLFGLTDTRHQEVFYRLLQKYSFRLLLHDLLQDPASPKRSAQLSHYASEASVGEMLATLTEIGVVEQVEQGFRLCQPGTPRIGDVLEHYVALILQREFGMSAISGVSLQGGNAGGDYDVLALWQGRLLFVETKTAPPKGIHNPEIAAFYQRVKALLPDLAIFLDDTHLRVKDKIVLMFEEELIRLKGIESLHTMPIERVKDQIFHLNHQMYIINSRHGLSHNFIVVFRDYLHYHTGVNFLG